MDLVSYFNWLLPWDSESQPFKAYYILLCIPPFCSKCLYFYFNVNFSPVQSVTDHMKSGISVCLKVHSSTFLAMFNFQLELSPKEQ